MNLTSPSQVKSWCIANGFHPNKVLGQNFLIDRNALEAIVDAGELQEASNVLEIGPGLIKEKPPLFKEYIEYRLYELNSILEKTKGFESLSIRLMEAVTLRTKNPDASLQELSDISEEVIGRYISKSGLSHCFKDLELYYLTLKNQKEKENK